MPHEEAKAIESDAIKKISAFYQDPKVHLTTPLDVVGYSRGAVEAVDLVNQMIGVGVPLLNTKKTTQGVATFVHYYPWIGFTGIISAVMGPFTNGKLWPKSLPPHVYWMYQALDAFPWNPFLAQYTITCDGATRGYPPADEPGLGHIAIGHDPGVFRRLRQAAVNAGVPMAAL